MTRCNGQVTPKPSQQISDREKSHKVKEGPTQKKTFQIYTSKVCPEGPEV